jgi:hypothetical protein
MLERMAALAVCPVDDPPPGLVPALLPCAQAGEVLGRARADRRCRRWAVIGRGWLAGPGGRRSHGCVLPALVGVGAADAGRCLPGRPAPPPALPAPRAYGRGRCRTAVAGRLAAALARLLPGIIWSFSAAAPLPPPPTSPGWIGLVSGGRERYTAAPSQRLENGSACSLPTLSAAGSGIEP